MSKLKEYLEASKKINFDDEDELIEDVAMDVLTMVSNNKEYKKAEKDFINLTHKLINTFVRQKSKTSQFGTSDIYSIMSDFCMEKIKDGDAELLDVILSGK